MKLECLENTDCAADRSCVNNLCVDVCAEGSNSGACGPNSQCNTVNHTPLCSCAPGFNGDPRIGCSRILTCARDNECPTNMMCAFGVCSRKNISSARFYMRIFWKRFYLLSVARCSSIRECLDTQVCASGKCVPRCTKNTDCPGAPGLSQCRGGVCVAQDQCRRDFDCGQNQVCRRSRQPRQRGGNRRRNGSGKKCVDVCKVPNACGKNAGCRGVSHKAQCICPKGFFGNPFDQKQGCLKKLCNDNSDCPGDGKCENFVCTAPQEGETCYFKV